MKSDVFLKYFVNGSNYQILKCAMFYPCPGVRKYWLSMLNNFDQCGAIETSPRSER